MASITQLSHGLPLDLSMYNPNGEDLTDNIFVGGHMALVVFRSTQTSRS
jgi:hypothetical protein